MVEVETVRFKPDAQFLMSPAKLRGDPRATWAGFRRAAFVDKHAAIGKNDRVLIVFGG